MLSKYFNNRCFIKNIVAVFFLLSTTSSFSQYIEGKVLDIETKLPIEDVYVYIENRENATLTDDKGTYYLNLPKKSNENITIHFSHIGYQELVIPYDSTKKEYSVYLIGKVNPLSEIELTEKRNLKPSINYTKLTSMKSGIHSFGSVLNNGKIYIVGGDASFALDGVKKSILKYENTETSFLEAIQKSQGSYATQFYKENLIIYDIKSNTIEIDSLEFIKRAHNNLAYYKNNLFVLGGTMLSKNKNFEYLNDKIEVCNLENKTIKIDLTNPHQAANFASFVYQDNLIVMGGSTKLKRNGYKEYSKKVHLYNFSSGYWYELDNMTSGKEVSGILINDTIYLIGGFCDKSLSEIESYNLITKKWKKEGELFYGISNPAIASYNNTIYIFDNGKIITYNILLKELNEYFIDLEVTRSKMFYKDHKLYIVGGLKKTSYSLTPSSGIYSIDILEFEKTTIRKQKVLK